MRVLMATALVLCPVWVAAEDWVPMSGEEIRAALTDRKLQYANAWQDFRVSGRTLYNAGADSWGYWRVEGDQYCSQWPPSDLWACYGMARSGDQLRFVGQGDDITDAVYAD
ncbi:hypothetical protein [uncultured Roseobacter sp.]|uniref:hypothetical protein n=1 Tax=uncultured Roseobacter sp. TaxID=114847 RepID=UPI00261C7CA7|nr:hypothetical protein [uncultured Roseobacter sp.]